MKLKCVGWVHNQGSGTNPETGLVFEFDSIMLECLSKMSVKGTNVRHQGGMHYKKVKFKTSDLSAVFPEVPDITVADLDVLVGQWLAVDGTQYNTSTGSYISPDEIQVISE